MLGVALPALALLLRNPLLALYGMYPATEGLAGIAYEAAITRMLVMFVPYFTIAFMQLGSGILQGLGKAVVASVTSLIGKRRKTRRNYRRKLIFRIIVVKMIDKRAHISYNIKCKSF